MGRNEFDTENEIILEANAAKITVFKSVDIDSEF